MIHICFGLVRYWSPSLACEIEQGPASHCLPSLREMLEYHPACVGNSVPASPANSESRLGLNRNTEPNTCSRAMCCQVQAIWDGLLMCTCQWISSQAASGARVKTEGGSGLCPFGSRFLFYTPVAAVRHKLWNEKTKTWKDIPARQALLQMLMAHPMSLVLVFWRQGLGP